jgi:hypothetical protein
VTVTAVLALLAQVALNYFAYTHTRKVLAGAAWSDLHALAAFGALIGAGLLGIAGLPAMLRAGSASRFYRISLGVVMGAVAIVAGGCTLLFVGFSLAAGLEGALTLGTGVVFFGAYAFAAGTLSVLMLFRSEAARKNHGLVRAALESSEDPWDVDLAPSPRLPGAVRPVPAPPKPPAPSGSCPRCPARGASLQDLVHTELLAASGKTPAPPENRGESRCEVRRCGFCSTVWWVDVREGWEQVDARVLEDPGASADPVWTTRGSAFRSSLTDAIERARQFVRSKSFQDRLIAREAAERPPWRTL